MLTDQNKRAAIIGTILFHLVLFVVLIFTSLTPPEPPRPAIGMAINLGSSNDGMGDIQPDKSKEVAQTPPPKSNTVDQKEKVVTQDQTKTVQASDQQKQNKKTEPKTDPVEEPVIDSRFTYKKKTKSTSGESEGETNKPGDQGKKEGDKNSTNRVGNGTPGITANLIGRVGKSLPEPSKEYTESGTVVVKIWVNKSGRVTNAVVLEKGTNTADSQLRKLAVEAAKQSLFDAKPDAAEVQVGTIEYVFMIGSN